MIDKALGLLFRGKFGKKADNIMRCGVILDLYVRKHGQRVRERNSRRF